MDILSFASSYRVATALLQTIPQAVFTLADGLDGATAISRLQALTFVDKRATATAQTLDFVAQRLLTPAQGRRVGAQALVVVLVGSESQDSMDALQQSVQELHATGARVLVVGTNDTAQQSMEMQLIASSAADVYNLETMETLAAANYSLGQQVLAPIICRETQPSSSVGAASSSVGAVLSTGIGAASSSFVGLLSSSLAVPPSSAVFGSAPLPSAAPSSVGVSAGASSIGVPASSGVGGVSSSGVVGVPSSIALGASSSVVVGVPSSVAGSSSSSSTTVVQAGPSSSVGAVLSSVGGAASSSVGSGVSSVGGVPSSSGVQASPTPGPGPEPPTYCAPFKQQDVVFVLSASGQTGQSVFQRFVNVAASMITLLPAGTSTVR